MINPQDINLFSIWYNKNIRFRRFLETTKAILFLQTACIPLYFEMRKLCFTKMRRLVSKETAVLQQRGSGNENLVSSTELIT